MTVSSRCSELLFPALVSVLLVIFPLQARSQRSAWSLPQEQETVRVRSVAGGYAFARDTYLSASRYSGWAFGFEDDSWTVIKPDGIFKYGRMHYNMFFSPMKNRVDGGNTIEAGGCNYTAFMWPAVEHSRCDLLIGPALLMELGALYNLQNSNNPVNAEGYIGGGVCVDNTFRFSLFRYPMALQATLYLPLAGIGFAPDYDQPYYYMYKYGDFEKALHFISPFNNRSLTQQIALVFPLHGNRFRVGYTFDYTGNNLGGHARRIGNGMLTLGYAMRLQYKEWDR